MTLKRVCAVVAVLSFASVVQGRAATPTVGQPAPALTFTQLYNAPEGTKTDWPSLHGKVVVLEFWATWCAPCIAQIPHLNELSQSLASSNVQFISVDDEDPDVVKTFMAKKHMESWVGVSKTIFDDYGVQARPTTIVIDTQGRIAARLNPEQLEKDQLVALAGGKPVAFPVEDSGPPELAKSKKAMQDVLAAMKNPAAKDAVKPLFEISIRPGDPDGTQMTFTSTDSESDQSSYDMKNAPLSALVPLAEGVPEDRITLHTDDAKARYDLHLSAPNLDVKKLAPAIEIAVSAAAGVKISHLASEEDVYVLQATPKASTLLAPTVSTHGSMCSFQGSTGKLTIVNTSLDKLAPTLEKALKVPVVNETGIPGEFDAGFTLPKDSFESAKAALEANLGLTLVKARRTIDHVVVDPLPAPTKSSQPTTAADKSAPTPGEPAQMIAVPRQ
jgi:uncharacterized protein (TIGR03435 family)